MEFNITFDVDYDKETIELIEEYQGKINKYIVDTREQAIREALIKLGWSPPK